MPLHSEDLPSEARRKFCLALKAARERKGISLAKIAEATKIPASLFEAFERNDLKRWPKGLFRRSFFRDYVRVIGLPVAEACEEFVRLFPDDENARPAITATAVEEVKQAEDVRLVFDESWHGPRASVLIRLLVALSDAGVVIFVAAAIAWMAGLDQGTTTATVALTYFSFATAVLGESPTRWAFSRRHVILDEVAPLRSAVATVWQGSAEVISHGFTATEEAPPDPSPRLRVRIKVPQ
jgi:transcriptional regulator with XRE-family HTH domain